jgi:hypothetical protein
MKFEAYGGKISGRSGVTQQSYGVGVEKAGKERIRSERQGPVGLEKCDSKALRGPQHSLAPPETKRILLKTKFFVNACLR